MIQEREQNFLTGVFTCEEQRLGSKLHLVCLDSYSKASFPKLFFFSTVKFLVVFLPSPKMIDSRDFSVLKHYFQTSQSISSIVFVCDLCKASFMAD